MKKKLLSITALLLVSIILAVSLCSCSIDDFSGVNISNNPEKLPEGMVFPGPSIPYGIDVPNEDNTSTTKALMSVVSVIAKNSTSESRGSGVIYQTNKIAGDAYIITNFHVVYNDYGTIMPEIYVMLYGLEAEQYRIKAKYVGGSAQYDIAVLKVSDSYTLRTSDVEEAVFADSEKIKIYDEVAVIGNALGYGISATKGCINVTSEYISMVTADSAMLVNRRVIRTDAAVNSGNSGGGLFDKSGKLIGIIKAKAVGNYADNMGYAIPSNVAKAVADNIIYFCDGTELNTVYKCTLGIEVETSELYSSYDEATNTVVTKETVKIVSIADRTKESLYMLEEGDIIRAITIDGKRIEISKRYMLTEAMLLARDGSDITVEYTHHGSPKEFSFWATSNIMLAYN